MTAQQIYLRALERLQARITTMERNLDGASLSTHEEFEELRLIIALLERVTGEQQQHVPALRGPSNTESLDAWSFLQHIDFP